MQKLYIEREKWVRGKLNGQSALLNRENNMCCLGFHCHQIDKIPLMFLKNKGQPDNIQYNEIKDIKSLCFNHKEGHEGTMWASCTEFVSEAIDINDDEDIDEIEREYRIKDLFEDHDIKVIFK